MKHFSLIISLFLCFAAGAQQARLSGTVTDDKKSPLSAAVVTLSDKQSEKFHVIANKDGTFEITGVSAGFYYLIVTYVGKELYVDSLLVTNNNMNLGSVTLLPATNMLSEVNVIRKAKAIGQSDDTLEFNSSAYKVNPDADASDLVKKMPAIDISGNTVTAQGEQVLKVLVDGKPFFGSDAIATLKNLPADIVDKVQLYNEKSDQERFTGFSEGPTVKTINIVTKTEMRHGTFGNVYSGYGTDDAYGVGGVVNRFDGDRRITFTAQSNNTNEQNFTDPNAATNSFSNGITRTNAGGVNYSDRWADKVDVSGSYFFNETNNNVSSQQSRSYILPVDSGQTYNQSSTSISKNYSHRFNARMDYTIDTQNSLLWQPTLSINQQYSDMTLQGNTYQDNAPLNAVFSDNSMRGIRYSLDNTLLYRHKFSRKGRTLSAQVAEGSSNNNGIIPHTSQNIFYASPLLNDSLNQLAKQIQANTNVSGNVTYTEPAGASGMFKLEYKMNYTAGNALNNTNDYSPITGEYSVPDSVYSSSFYNNNLTNSAGISYQFNKNNIEFSLEGFYEATTFYDDQFVPQAFSAHKLYRNFLPSATFRYKFSRTKNLQVNYSTNTNYPSVYQLQNVINNLNPLFLTTGNPGLREPFRHNLVLRYSAMGADGKSNLSLSLNGSYVSNNITTSNIIAQRDTFIGNEQILLAKGSQLSMPVNINGTSNISANISYGIPLDALKCNMKFGLDGGFFRLPSIINDVVNIQQNENGGGHIALTSNISERIDFMLLVRGSMNSSVNSLSPTLNNTYFNSNSEATINITVWKYIVLKSNITYITNSGMTSAFNENYVLWNASVGKKIFKNKQGYIRVAAYNMLDQNSNVQHIVTSEYIENVRNSMLQRYCLLIFSYKIGHFDGH